MAEKVNRSDELKSLLDSANTELAALTRSVKDTAIQRFKDLGGCETCHGRGWVVTWDTMDSMSGCYAEYGDCTNEECTPQTRSLTGFSTRNTKYDSNRGTQWYADYTKEESLLKEKLSKLITRLQCEINEEISRWTPREGVVVEIVKAGRGPKVRRVPVGVRGLVKKSFSNDWGTQKLIVVDKHGQKWWPNQSYVKVIDPEPDISLWEKLDLEDREKNGFPIIGTVMKVSRTGKAALLRTTTSKEVWVPVSQVSELKTASPGQTLSILLPWWIAKDKGFVTGG